MKDNIQQKYYPANYTLRALTEGWAGSFTEIRRKHTVSALCQAKC